MRVHREVTLPIIEILSMYPDIQKKVKSLYSTRFILIAILEAPAKLYKAC